MRFLHKMLKRMNRFGTKLGAVLSRLGKTQQWAADAIGKSQSWVNKLISGAEHPTTNSLARLFAALSVLDRPAALEVAAAALQDQRERIGVPESDLIVSVSHMCAFCSTFRASEINPGGEGYCRHFKVPVDPDDGCADAWTLDESIQSALRRKK